MARNQDLRKPQNAKKTLFKLLRYLSKSRFLLLLVFLLVAISTVGIVVASYFIKVIIDSYLMPMLTGEMAFSMRGILLVLCKMGAFFIASVFATYGYAKVMMLLSQKTVNTIRRDLFHSMQALPISFFDTNTHGDLMSRYTNDVDAIRNFFSQSFIQVSSAFLSVSSCLVMMLVLSPALTLLVLVSLVIMAIVIRVMSKPTSKYFKQQQTALGAVNGYIEETIEGQKVVKVFNHEAEVKAEFETLNQTLREASAKANTYANALMPIVGNLSQLTYAVVAAFGGIACLTGNVTVGTLSAFLQYSKSFSDPLTTLSQQFNDILSALAGAERIFKIIEMPAEEDTGYVKIVNAKVEDGKLVPCKEHTGTWAWEHPHQDGTVTYQKLEGKVEFEHINFSYDGKKQILKNVSLYAKPGQKIAFVGSTGAGKTTITNLLNRFYEISDGKIRYDGINIQKIKKEDLRASLAMVLQDTHLFTGTVEENIRYGKLDATHEDVVYAAKLANAHEFIKDLPHGYDTIITGDGNNLSQGQRQLLAIARAAVADPPVLVLDEATSSVDTQTEHLIEQGMDKLMENRTTFVIAHRLSTVRNADAIMVLENGEIIERGDHEDLLSQKGKYYQLYTGQFELT